MSSQNQKVLINDLQNNSPGIMIAAAKVVLVGSAKMEGLTSVPRSTVEDNRNH